VKVEQRLELQIDPDILRILLWLSTQYADVNRASDSREEDNEAQNLPLN